MSNAFQRSFTNTTVKTDTNTTDRSRPTLINKRLIQDVVENWVGGKSSSALSLNRSMSGIPIPHNQNLVANYQKTVNDQQDIRNILAMNPDAQLAIDIMVHGTLSPNNTLETQLRYTSDYDKIGPLKSQLLTDIQEIINKHTSLEDNLPRILQDAKYDVGSYALLVIPVNRIRELIQDTTTTNEIRNDGSGVYKVGDTVKKYGHNIHFESAQQTVLNKASAFTVEFTEKSLKFESHQPTLRRKEKKSRPDFYIHDDLSSVTLSHLIKKRRMTAESYSTLEALDGFSTYKAESTTNVNSSHIDEVADNRQYTLQDALRIHEDFNTETLDLPHCVHIPHGSIFVVHTPGNPEEHIGYFIAYDMSGNPVSSSLDYKSYNPNMNPMMTNDANTSDMGNVVNYAAGNLEYGPHNAFQSMQDQSQKAEVFMALMQDKLVEKIREKGGEDITLAEHRALFSIMFSRLLANKQTQLVYVPASLLTYIAFEYDDNGNGVSLVVKHKTIGILNSALTLANTNAAINNAVDPKDVRITFDDDETDFDKTTALVLGNISRNTLIAQQLLMSTDTNRQMEHLAQRGYQVSFESHPHFPGTSVEINNLDRERTIPDTDLIDNTKSLLIQSLGSTPEVVDMARNVEFASSYFQTNLTAARRAIADQKIFTKFLNKFIRSYILNAPLILKWMISEIDKSRENNPSINDMRTVDVVKAFINSIEVKLPKPDMVKTELLIGAIEQHEKLVDTIIKYTISEDAIPGNLVGDELGNALEMVRAEVKTLIMGEWLASNNMLTDSFFKALFNQDKEELTNLMIRMEKQHEFTLEFLSDHTAVVERAIAKVNNKVEAMREAQGEENSSSSDFSSSDDSGGSGDSGGDDNDSDDGGVSDDPFADINVGDGDGGDSDDPFS